MNDVAGIRNGLSLNQSIQVLRPAGNRISMC